MKRALSLLLCFCMLLGFCGCVKNGDKEKKDEIKEIKTNAENLNADEIIRVDSTMKPDAFDENFLTYIAENTEGNYMVSPLSFRYALGLLLAGAEGETKTELLNALGVESVEEWTAYCTKFNGFTKQFYEGLASETEQYEDMVKEGYADENSKPFRALNVANSVWKREDIKEDFTDTYKDYISKNFGAEYMSFTPDNAASKINSWASDKTHKMIEKLLPESYDATNLAVVLMNALYFKDTWTSGFDTYATEDGDFHGENGTTVTKTFMNQTEKFDYYADDETQLVVLPMDGGISMAFVLGNTENIGDKISSCEYRKVNVKIPKMDIETSFTNKEFMNFLAENGVTSAFDSEKADFSAMIDHRIWVDDIIQKTKIKTDEDGVEAAAVTAIMMLDEACIEEPEVPVDFIADRPFSFYIYTTCDDVTSIMFAGEIVE